MRKPPLGRLRSIIVISNWAKYVEEEDIASIQWLYKNQSVYSIENSSVIFVPVDFSRIFQNEKSHILLWGAGIYWTQFTISKKQPGITTDVRYLTALVLPEEQWLDSHFNTEPFVFPPSQNFIMSDYLQEFPFQALSAQVDIDGYHRRAFGRGLILAQLVFPFKEPLLKLRKKTESYEEFDSPDAPMRILISKFADGKAFNEISIEKPNEEYEKPIPGIRKIKPSLHDIFPETWRNEIYLKGLRREIATISKDFAFIGAPLILK
jgi:hypothetical protein